LIIVFLRIYQQNVGYYNDLNKNESLWKNKKADEAKNCLVYLKNWL